MKWLQKIFKKPVVAVTHNGAFHADDVMACAILSIYHDRKSLPMKIIRSRDPEIIKKGDIVFDVGGVYDAQNYRFDHHQTGGAGSRNNGIPYSSVGLIWKSFGPELCAPYNQLVEKIDQEIIQYIDAQDNGYDIPKDDSLLFSGYFFPGFYMVERATWKESVFENSHDDMKRFLGAVAKARDFFERYITISIHNLEATEKIKNVYQNSKNKSVLEFEQDFTRIVFVANLVNLTEPLLYIYPNRTGKGYSIETVPKNFGSYENRISFPKSWAGLHGKDLQEATGVSDAVFCHNGLFLCKTETLESARIIAKQVIESITI